MLVEKYCLITELESLKVMLKMDTKEELNENFNMAVAEMERQGYVIVAIKNDVSEHRACLMAKI